MIKVEFLKQRKRVWWFVFVFPIILNVLLYIDLTFRYRGYLLVHQNELALTNWQLIFKEQTVFYFSELYYLILSLIIYEVFAVEFENNAWLTLISSPFRNKYTINSKMLITVAYTFIFWVSDYISLYVTGKAIDSSLEISLIFFLKTFTIQFVSSLMIILTYFLILLLIRKVSGMIATGILIMILTISIYYNNYNFEIYLPFTYLSHAFRVTENQFYMILLANIMLIFVFYLFIQRLNKRSFEMKL
ncbi:ABC transporter permease [Streptococcus sp. E17BB]|uniref:ABC transporter permease n=1 Tax=Streptococcus sp. E17BB TaxID=3278714 RepID=UPI00359E935D